MNLISASRTYRIMAYGHTQPQIRPGHLVCMYVVLYILYSIGTSVEGCPKIAYNLQYKHYLVSYLFRATRINSNHLVVLSQVVSSGLILELSNPVLSVSGYNELRQPTDIEKLSSLVYNPITNGFVIAVELKNARKITEITAIYLTRHGNFHLARSVFSYISNVKQPTVAYHSRSQSFVFVSQLEHFGTMPAGMDALLLRTELASGRAPIGDLPNFGRLIRFTSVRQSFINLHSDGADGCLRICYLIENNSTLAAPTCAKVCETDSGGWDTRDEHISFRTCKASVEYPSIIEYPVNGAIFAVWEKREGNSTSNRLQGYHVNSRHFEENTSAANYTYGNPLAVYKSRDAQVCVSWKHHNARNSCSRLALRCFKLSRDCDDPCSCPGDVPVCGEI